MKLLTIALAFLALASPALAAESPAPQQAAPQTAQPAAPQSIPLSSEPATSAEEDEEAAKQRKDNLYTFLVFACALLPLAAFALWKLLGSPGRSQSLKYQPRRHSAGPADKRRLKRAAQPKKARDKKKRDMFYR